MVTRTLQIAAGIVGTALGLSGSAAYAVPGGHVHLGNAVLIPDLDIGAEYHTNAFRSESEPVGAANLRISPGFAVEAKGPQVRFAAQGEYKIRKYFQSQFVNLDRYSDFSFSGQLHAREKQTVGFTGIWTADMHNLPVDRGGIAPFSTRFRNHLSPAIVVRGGAVQFMGQLTWDFDDYQSAAGAQYSTTDPGVRGLNRRNTGRVDGELSWMFLPRTAFVLSAEYGYLFWEDNWLLAVNTSDGTPVIDLGGHLALPNSTEYRLQAGFRGRITNRLVLSLQGGYGRAIYDEESVLRDASDEGGEETAYEDGDAFTVDVTGSQRYVGSAQLIYEVATDSFFTLGVTRNFQDSWFSNFLHYNHVYANFSARMGPHLGAKLGFSGRQESYFGEISRSDVMLRTSGDVSYYLDKWASLTVGAAWDERASDQATAEYDDVMVFVYTTWTY